MLGTFKAEVKIVDNETISVDGKLIKVVSNRDPLKLPWAELGIDIVIEVLQDPDLFISVLFSGSTELYASIFGVN